MKRSTSFIASKITRKVTFILLSIAIALGAGFHFFSKLSSDTYAFSTGNVEITNVSSETIISDAPIAFKSFYAKFYAQDENFTNLNFHFSVSTDNKNWSSEKSVLIERHVHTEHEDEKEADKDDLIDENFISEQIFLDKEYGYIKMRVDEPDRIDKYSLHFINNQPAKVSSIKNIVNTAPYNFDYLPGMNVVTRDGWGCPDQNPASLHYCKKPDWSTQFFPTTHIILHHTATSNASSDWAAEVRSIWYFHSQVRGWTDIGYNFLIDPNGVIYEGRYGGEGVRAGHTLDHNEGTVGVALMGTYSSKDVTVAAQASLDKLTKTLAIRYGLNLDENAYDRAGMMNLRLSGHRNWGATECPGEKFYNTFGTIRNKLRYGITTGSIMVRKEDTCPNGYTLFDGHCKRYGINLNTTTSLPTPIAMASDASGNIYVVNGQDNFLYKVTGNSVTSINTLGVKPTALLVTSNGDVYTANVGSDNVSRITSAGVASIFASTGPWPTEIVRDGFGNMYTANFGNNTISKITIGGSSSIFSATEYDPIDLLFNATGVLYSANYSSNSLTKIQTDGTTTHMRIPGNNPIDMVLNGAGDIFVANAGSRDVSIITPANSISTFATLEFPPTSISIDNFGNLWMTHTDQNMISKVTPSGFVDTINGVFGNPVSILPWQNNTYLILNKTGNSISTFSIDYSNTTHHSDSTYRFWSNKHTAHFFTSSVAERNQIIAQYPSETWKYEGIAYRTFQSPYDGELKPVYRFYSGVHGAHFYTQSEQEKNEVIQKYSPHTWNYEGVAFYAYNKAVPGTKPVYRFWSSAHTAHFFTMSEAEKNQIIQTYPESVWKYEGVAYWTWE